jgi:hypothetical protein
VIRFAQTVPALRATYIDQEDTIGHDFYLPLLMGGTATPKQIEQKAVAVHKHLHKIVGTVGRLRDLAGETDPLIVLLQTVLLAKCDTTLYVTRYEERARATEGLDGKRVYVKAHFRLGWSTDKAKLLEGLRSTKKGMK